ncbi:DNA polymerase IV [Flavitalea sp. BT771]|uniref:DNA polymerase IV n=1 Tax=Flavitalea sp. BT771 TaxID=3063329 RepID=UPI0026E2A4CC|nr:DNA polymerase IV [Flavitalea sp. BT771]MDO6432078.1 DNA polymerase IV [Flavitalea sp. BT771]MDV6220987.1 DNA polymerase IV [Flavitalea sp. BT771]
MFLNPNRHIAHFDLDAFFVSVECLKDSRLKGRPLIVGGSGDRGVVAACSYEARKFGIHSAMPIRMARRLCPEALIIRGDMESYAKYSRLVTDILRDDTPLFEKASIDEFYIDMTGMDKYHGCSLFVEKLKKKVLMESGLPISYGLASNKLISKVATNEVKPNGQIEIPFGEEKNFLAPLKIGKLPGIGQENAGKLIRRGVETVRTLAAIPVEMMETLFGKTGIDLWRKANGLDDSPVIPYREQRSISTERTFQTDTIDLKFLHAELVRMTEAIGFELRSQNKLTGCVTVKLRYSNFDTVVKQKTIDYSNADLLLLQTAQEIFEKLYDRRMLIRLLGIRFTRLVPGNYQIKLYEDTQENIRLYQSIDHIKRRFGEQSLMRAVGVPRH